MKRSERSERIHRSIERFVLGKRARQIANSDWFWIGVIGIATLYVYTPMLGHWFKFDDFVHLRAGRFIGPFGFVQEVFDYTTFSLHEEYIDFIRDESISLPFLAYRPLSFLTIESLYVLFGKNPVGYHAFSLVVHLTNTLVLWFIARRLLQPRAGAHFVALVFALHPAHTLTLSWISDISTPLATLFALLALLTFMKSLDQDEVRLSWLISSFYLYGASVFFHQETLAWSPVFVAYFFLLRPRISSSDRSNAGWIVLVPYIVLAMLVAAIQRGMFVQTAYHQQVFTVGHHLLTQFKNYASNSVFPTRFDWSEAHFAAFIVFLVIIVAVSALPAMTRFNRSHSVNPRLGIFAVVWFLFALAPLLTPSVFLNIGAFNRKLYVVGPSLAIILVTMSIVLLEMIPKRFSFRAVVIGAALVTVMAVGAIQEGGRSLDGSRRTAESARSFIDSLRSEHPDLPEGGTLYVLNAPLSLTIFDDVFLVSAVQAFYGRVQTYSVTEPELETIAARIRSGTNGAGPFTIFEYEVPP